MTKLKTQFAEVGSDLGIEGLYLADEAPGVSAARKMTKVKEEVVETFLCLHLSELIGAPVTHIRRASPIVSAQDVLALDALGRIHLFEVKRERIKRDHVRQLGQYLLGYVFVDPRGFRAEPRNYHEETVEDRAALIAGAYGDRDVRKMGVEQVLRLMGADAQRLAGHLLGHPLRPSWWDKRLTATQKSELRAKAVLCDARRGDIEHMDWEALVHLAERWAAKFDSSRLSADGAFVAVVEPERSAGSANHPHEYMVA